MPRTPSKTNDDIIAAAMNHFWQHGYNATSMDELVDSIGVSRHAIYANVGSKKELYRRGFLAYQNLIVSPAFSAVESADAGLNTISQYFETQISLAESMGLPGPGCLVANATTETAPHDSSIAKEVERHNRRLKDGFFKALSNEQSALPSKEIHALADFLVVTAQGLWSMSRTVTSAGPLRSHASTLMSLLRGRLES